MPTLVCERARLSRSVQTGRICAGGCGARRKELVHAAHLSHPGTGRAGKGEVSWFLAGSNKLPSACPGDAMMVVEQWSNGSVVHFCPNAYGVANLDSDLADRRADVSLE